MKKIALLMLFAFLFILGIASVDAASYNYNVKYVSGDCKSSTGCKYNLLFNLKDLPSTQVNHLEGELILRGYEIISTKLENDFVGTFDKNTAKYNLTSKKTYTKSDGEVVFASIMARKIIDSDDCRVEIKPSVTEKVNINQFTMNKDAYKDGVKISNIKVGEEFEYRIKVTGLYNYLETDVVNIKDVIPEELEVIDNGGATLTSSNTYTWSLGTFKAGTETKTISIKVRLKDTLKRSLYNKSTLTVEGQDPIEAGNTINIVYSDIQVNKEASKNKIAPGSVFDYKITVKNMGNAVSENIVLKDTLDNNLTLISSDARYTKNNNEFSFDIGKIEAGKSVTITLHVKENNTLSKGEIVNTAIAVEEGKKTIEATAVVTVEKEESSGALDKPSISIKKSSNEKEVQVGKEFKYTIEITNNNSLNLKNVILTDHIDDNLEIIDASGATYENGVLTWQFDLDSKKDKAFTIRVKAKDDTKLREIKNQAKVYYNDLEEESNEVVIIVIEGDKKESLDKPSISIKKSSNEKEVQAGKEFKYTIEIINNNSLNLKNVIVTDHIDDNLEIIDASGATYENGVLTWQFDLDGKKDKTFTIRVKVKDDTKLGKIKNRAKVLNDDFEEESNEVVITVVEVENPKTGMISGGIILVLVGVLVILKIKNKNKLLKI